MNNILVGLIFGTVAGIIDVIPMIIQKIPWNANISAFSMWIVVGVLIATTKLKLAPVPKGLLISLMVLLPHLFIIGTYGINTLIPVIAITVVLGSLLGWIIDKCVGKAKG